MTFCVIIRELDFNVFSILNVDIITKAALDTNMNTKVTIVSTILVKIRMWTSYGRDQFLV